MRGLFAALIVMLLATGGWAETFDLRKQGKLELYPVGEWKFHTEDVGDLKVVIAPKDPRINASCQMNIAIGGTDDFPTREKLQHQIVAAGQRMIEDGEFVESAPKPKAFYCKQGFGFYFTLTDPKLVGKDPVPGDYKQITFGLIRVNAGVMIQLQILSDGERTEEFQQLLGMIEGMEWSAK